MVDFNFMAAYSTVSAMADYDFDNLFVPFRCVSSDIVKKKYCIIGHPRQSSIQWTTIKYFVVNPYFVK